MPATVCDHKKPRPERPILDGMVSVIASFYDETYMVTKDKWNRMHWTRLRDGVWLVRELNEILLDLEILRRISENAPELQPWGVDIAITAKWHGYRANAVSALCPYPPSSNQSAASVGEIMWRSSRDLNQSPHYQAWRLRRTT